MKKLVIALCAVAVAAFSQAATVDWMVMDVNAAGTDGTGWSSGFLNSSSATVTLIIGSSLSGGVIGDTLTFEGNNAKGFADGVTEQVTATIADMKSDTPYYAQISISSGESTLLSQVFTIEASGLDGDYVNTLWSGAGNTISVTEITGVSELGEHGVFTSSGWSKGGHEPTVTPEPTSGLLLLIGMAGLALRRRRA